MARGQQKLESQKKAQAKKESQKGSQIEAREAAFKAQVSKELFFENKTFVF
jgi:hypothetical protein